MIKTKSELYRQNRRKKLRKKNSVKSMTDSPLLFIDNNQPMINFATIPVRKQILAMLNKLKQKINITNPDLFADSNEPFIDVIYNIGEDHEAYLIMFQKLISIEMPINIDNDACYDTKTEMYRPELIWNAILKEIDVNELKYFGKVEITPLWEINIQRNYIRSLPSDLYYANVGLIKPYIDFKVYLSKEDVLDLKTDQKINVINKWIKENGIELTFGTKVNIKTIYKINFEEKKIYIHDINFDKVIESEAFRKHKIKKNQNKRNLKNIANAFIKSDSN